MSETYQGPQLERALALSRILGISLSEYRKCLANLPEDPQRVRERKAKEFRALLEKWKARGASL